MQRKIFSLPCSRSARDETLRLLLRLFFGVIHADVAGAGEITGAPPNFHQNLIAFHLFANLDGFIGIGDWLAVNFHNHVAPLQSGIGGIGIGINIRNHGAFDTVRNFQFLPRLRIQIRHRHAIERIRRGIVCVIGII